MRIQPRYSNIIEIYLGEETERAEPLNLELMSEEHFNNYIKIEKTVRQKNTTGELIDLVITDENFKRIEMRARRVAIIDMGQAKQVP